MTNNFWDKWFKANELEQLSLIKTLNLHYEKSKEMDNLHIVATLTNSYLKDLVNYLVFRSEKRVKEAMKILKSPLMIPDDEE